jgi:hypothetical protein
MGCSIICNPKKDPTATRIRERNNLFREGRRMRCLDFKLVLAVLASCRDL